MIRIVDVFREKKTTRELRGCIFANSIVTPGFCKTCPAPSLCRESEKSREEFFGANGNGTRK